MRVLIQKVSEASVTVEGEVISSIGKGLLVFVGIGDDDNDEEMIWLSKKITQLRIFLDENGGASLKSLRMAGGPPPEDAAVLVGPEGGWSVAEEKAISAAGFEAFGLGRTILRAETASLAVLILLAHEWNW